MLMLTNAQVLAAAAKERLINVVSAPGSGKTTVAAERYGYQRYLRGDNRGVLGLTFNRAAAAELRGRVEARWGGGCVGTLHRVVTFDHLHVELLHRLLGEGKIIWPGGHTVLDVRDDYNGARGYRFLTVGNYIRFATLNSRNAVVSDSRQVAKPESGLGGVADHRAVLSSGAVSHQDVRQILRSAMQVDEMRQFASSWLHENYRALVIDEVYDGDDLDLYVAYLAAEAGLSVTLIGDPWQALYKWRGARPEVVHNLFDATSDRFVAFEQPESFRFVGDQMPQLARALRSGHSVTLPEVSSADVDVALARNWGPLWSVGDNVLPLAFRTVNNATDAALNLLLDVATRARLGVHSFGREGAIVRLGLDRDNFQARQEDALGPLLANLRNGQKVSQVLDDLREAIKALGARKPNRLSDDREAAAEAQLEGLAATLVHAAVVPGLTVFQAKGREWDRVGVLLSQTQITTLASGLQELDEEHCILYVAITRARYACGRLVDNAVGSDAAELSLGL
jgi:DNA helicase-2/ATP-dependent DNA helicase PcrA